MDGSSNDTASLDQADEEILTRTVTDEVLEAAAGAESAGPNTVSCRYTLPTCC
jgi:hypothetical protein